MFALSFMAQIGREEAGDGDWEQDNISKERQREKTLWESSSSGSSNFICLYGELGFIITRHFITSSYQVTMDRLTDILHIMVQKLKPCLVHLSSCTFRSNWIFLFTLVVMIESLPQVLITDTGSSLKQVYYIKICNCLFLKILLHRASSHQSN